MAGVELALRGAGALIDNVADRDTVARALPIGFAVVVTVRAAGAGSCARTGVDTGAGLGAGATGRDAVATLAAGLASAQTGVVGSVSALKPSTSATTIRFIMLPLLSVSYAL